MTDCYRPQIQEADKCNVYDTVVFEGPPKMEQTLWPRHCVQESWGAELHKDLKVSAVVVSGENPPYFKSQLRFIPPDKSSVKELSQILTLTPHFSITLN